MTPDPITALLVFFAISGALALGYRLRSLDFWKKAFEKQKILKTKVEDILKQLYHVEYGGKKATLDAMAGALKMGYGNLVSIIEEMSASGLITLSENAILLTNKGREYALKIIRVHRIWEKYLSEETGIDKSEWHQRAEKMEHRLTGKEVELLYKQLGSPRYDPHGDPIPTKTGEIIPSNNRILCGLKTGEVAKIMHIEDEPNVVYKQIIKEKLHIGQTLRVTESNDNNITFLSEGEEHTLSHVVASNIGARSLTKEEVFESTKVRLGSLEKGEKAIVVGISKECRGAGRRRLMDFGFINGAEVTTEMQSPSGEPKAFLIKNTLIALRDDQADFILIEKTA